MRTRTKCISHAVAFAVASAFAGLSAPTHGKTLKAAVETALANHPQVLSADAARRAAEQEVRQAKAGFYPALDLSANLGREHTLIQQSPSPVATGATLARRELGVTLSQKIYDGRETSAEVARQAARLTSAEERLADFREAIALRAVEAYLEVLKNRELVRLAQENLQYHRDTLEKVRLRVQGGVAQKADLQQAAGRLALAKSVLASREGKQREAEAGYQKVMGENPADLQEQEVRLFVGKDGLFSESLAQAIRQATETALTENPQLRTAEAEQSAAEAAVRRARAAYAPRVNVEASANRNQNIQGIAGDRDSETVMLVMRWNMYRGGADQAQEKASVERRFAAEDAADNARREVSEKVAVALYAKAASEQRNNHLREHVTSAAEVLESYQAQLELGRRSLLDVLNAENELFTARSNLASGKYEDVLNQYVIEASKGQLLKSLGIAPPEQQSDAAR